MPEIQADRSSLESELKLSKARFRAAIDAVAGILWTTDPIGLFVAEQPGWARITGHTYDEYKGFGWAKAIHKDDVGRVRALWARCVETKSEYNTEYRVINKEGVSRVYAARAIPILDDNENIIEWVGVQTDIDSQRRTEEALRESEHRSRMIVEHSGSLMWINNPAGECIFMNEELRRYTGCQIEQFKFADFIHPDDSETRKKSRLNIARQLRYDAQFRLRQGSGEYRWLKTSVAPLFDEDGKLFAWVGNAIDIEENVINRQHMETQIEVQRVLMDELNHRVRNTLAIIQSMVRATLRQNPEPEEFRKSFEGRLYGLSATHDILVAEKWHGANLEDVARAELRPFVAEDRWWITPGDMRLSATQATPIGLLFHELVTNAVKYGSLSNDYGKVRIEWKITRDRFELHWIERGGPPVIAPLRKGFGSRLVEGIGRQLLGEVVYNFNPDGIELILDVPRQLPNLIPAVCS